MAPQQVESRTAPPPESDEGYRPRWADPDAKPPEPGIENDPTPFNPADVDGNSDRSTTTINVDQCRTRPAASGISA